ncbi:hypothetical protein GRS48_12435 [Halorubrum sp. JWXQ-INN 858]|uniref:hypothetical protein n=1 Tax=Halorubrum sp. JWXQ-INN 858 TaxID=2690782 RepID=UPI001359E402|nr:hypothetical protein [Halorubrum sp. JWXQ-INN 858]MWV65620.1 hypothetical protein [Halorubrum sp. JWXQ-INN 858]
MIDWIDVARISVAMNLVMLLALTWIWARNYRSFRSKHALGLAVFGTVLLAQNALSLYFYLYHPVLAAWFATDMPPLAWRANIVVHAFQTVALAFLLWVTWD